MEIIYTLHGMKQIHKRNFSEDEIENTIKHPEKLEKQEGKYYAQKDIGRGIIEVVYEIEKYEKTEEKYIKVITAYYL